MNTTTNISFKSYSSRSKAKRALRDTFQMETETGIEAVLTTVDGKHGFYLKDGVPFAQYAEAEPQAEQPEAQAPEDVQAEQPATQDEQPEEESQDELPTPSALGAFAMSQLSGDKPAEEPTQTQQRASTGLKIERNREERNGVKMPSAGGLCRAVWDLLNNMMTHDEASGLANVPTVADIKKEAEQRGWNVNNAAIEYYQWRKFHGITGRGQKQI